MFRLDSKSDWYVKLSKVHWRSGETGEKKQNKKQASNTKIKISWQF